MYERADRIGGLLRYGIPEFKMEKQHLDRRLDQMRAEGTTFRAGVNVGVDITGADLRRGTTPSCWPSARRGGAASTCPARDLAGIHQAMEYLPLANRVQRGRPRREPDRRARASTS